MIYIINLDEKPFERIKIRALFGETTNIVDEFFKIL